MLVCGACEKEFEPRDGVVNVVRTAWDDPGVEVCPECINRLGSRGLLSKDPEDEKFKCRCGSFEHARCPVHDESNLIKPLHVRH